MRTQNMRINLFDIHIFMPGAPGKMYFLLQLSPTTKNRRIFSSNYFVSGALYGIEFQERVTMKLQGVSKPLPDQLL